MATERVKPKNDFIRKAFKPQYIGNANNAKNRRGRHGIQTRVGKA